MENSRPSPAGKPDAPAYRDEPEDDLASNSSAVRMSDIEYPEEETPLMEGFPEDELPAYSDVPDLPQGFSGGAPISYLVPPPLPQSCQVDNNKTTACHFQRYSQDPTLLEAMIREQAAYPPNYAVRLRGTHTETFKKRDGKEERRSVTDFDIRVNITHLLVCPNPAHAHDHRPCTIPSQSHPRSHDPPQELPTPSCKYIKLLGAEQEGYRGTVTKCLEGAQPSDPEASSSLSAWCAAYVADPHAVKTFVLRRQIDHHDAAKLEGLCRDLIQKTGYRGHATVAFEITHRKIIVHSPSRLNTLRYNRFLYWFCILTFLWIFTWPVLFFMTKRYEVITAIFPYRLDPERNRVPKALVQSEEAFFLEWHQALTRAVLGQHQGWVDGAYREETAQMARAGRATVTVQSTQNNLGGFVGGAVRMALGIPAVTGWGADS